MRTTLYHSSEIGKINIDGVIYLDMQNLFIMCDLHGKQNLIIQQCTYFT